MTFVCLMNHHETNWDQSEKYNLQKYELRSLSFETYIFAKNDGQGRYTGMDKKTLKE